MRILHVSALPVWQMGGKGGMPSLRETLRGHLCAGHKVILIYPRYHLHTGELVPELDLSEVCHQAYTAKVCWLPGLLRVRALACRLGHKGEPPYALRWIMNFTAWLLMTLSLCAAATRVRYQHRQRFDMVYAHNQYASLAGWLIGKLHRVPNVMRLYGTFLADLMKRPLVWLRYPVSAAGYLVPHQLLICTNDGTRGDEVARKLHMDPARFRFWQNGVNMPQGLPAETRDWVAPLAPSHLRPASQWIFTCSRLSYWKRLDRALRALKVCRDAGVDCQFLVAGDGPEQGPLMALSKELGLERDVVWLGAVAHKDIWRLMNVSDAFIITNDVTNRCNPLFEAISIGLPVVSVRDPSTSDLLEDGKNALLADRDDDAQLGQCLRKVCTSPDLARAMRQAQGAKAAGFWTWEQRLAAEVYELEQLARRWHGPAKAGSRSVV